MTFPAILAFVGSAGAVAVGVAAGLSKPQGVAQRSLALGLLLLAGEAAFQGASLCAESPERMAYWERLGLWAVSFVPGVWLCFALTYSRGNRQKYLASWRAGLLAFLVVPVGLVLFFQEKMILQPRLFSPDADRALPLSEARWALEVVLLAAAVLVLMSLERTFRASRGTMRWRLKFMVLGVGLIFVVRLYAGIQSLIFSAITPELGEANSVALVLGCALMARSMMRDGLLGAEVYPSQRFLQNSLTGLLAGIYLVTVGLLTKVVALLDGYTSFPLTWSFLLAALVGLMVLLLSDRLRQRLSHFVSRHLRRPQHDYRQIWRTFSERTTSLTDEPALCAAVVGWVSETFEVLSVTFLLAESGRDRLSFGASTSSPAGHLGFEPMPDSVRAEMAAALRQASQPIELGKCREGWAAVFQRGHAELLVPVVRTGELLGLLILSHRVDGLPFPVEDLDLLKSVADQTAGHLLAIRLHRRLLGSKEMEAFQTMSAFFVHDLKNTAATLSLMMENLPAHFDNPAFREDALGAVSNGVVRINELINRLSSLRQEPGLRPAEADLNQTVSEAVGSLPRLPQLRITVSLQDLPRIQMDGEKIQKVIVNLLVNARDALGGRGDIAVRTGRDSRWVWVSVSDDGPGIDPEFLAHSMFRPFQTTKKKGIGIGMFLSKALVEAHQGQIEVETQPGKGATFRVLLPIRR